MKLAVTLHKCALCISPTSHSIPAPSQFPGVHTEEQPVMRYTLAFWQYLLLPLVEYLFTPGSSEVSGVKCLTKEQHCKQQCHCIVVMVQTMLPGHVLIKSPIQILRMLNRAGLDLCYAYLLATNLWEGHFQILTWTPRQLLWFLKMQCTSSQYF